MDFKYLYYFEFHVMELSCGSNFIMENPVVRSNKLLWMGKAIHNYRKTKDFLNSMKDELVYPCLFSRFISVGRSKTDSLYLHYTICTDLLYNFSSSLYWIQTT